MSLQRIWITGATSGIGHSLAISLAKLNNQVIVSGRNKYVLAELQQRYPNNIIPIPFDITNKSLIPTIRERIKTTVGALDCVILNAGTCEYLNIKQFDVELIERVMNTNFFGFIYSLAIALPLLRTAKKQGKSPYLLGMSSTVAYTGLPSAEAYGSSKAAIRHFLQSLRADLTPEGIDISIICPGFVKTPLTDRNDFSMPMLISSEQAVKFIIKGMKKRQHEIHFPKRFSYPFKFFAALPSRWRNKLKQRMVKPT